MEYSSRPINWLTSLLFEAVHPFPPEKIHEEHDGAEAPGEGVGPEYHADIRDIVDADGDVGHADDAPEQQHDHHGDGGFPGAPQDSRDAVGEGQQEVEQGVVVGLGHAVGDHLGIPVEGGDQHRREVVDQNAHQLRRGDGAEDAEHRALLGPVVLPGAQVLADEGGHGQGEAGDGQKAEALDLGVGPAARHRHFPEFVDVGLDDHVGEGDDGVLEAGRETVGGDLAQHERIKADHAQINPVLGVGLHQPGQAQQGADELGQDGREGRGAHSQAESCDEYEV